MGIIENFTRLARKSSVLVIGETITDEFIKVEYQGQSMKSFCPVFRLGDQQPERQMGGAYAIYRHLKDFVGKIDLYSNDPSEIIKTRYMDANSGEKHIELNTFKLNDRKPKSFTAGDYDVVIVADFGHGFCDHVSIDNGFHLMCQTNSHNFGFNRISKWKGHRKKSICIDLREASLQINHQITTCTDEIMKELYDYELNTDELYVTVGKAGSVFTDGKQILRKPSFRTQIVDTIGAGDAFFGFSALCTGLGVPAEDKLLIPSLAASLTTTWLCNAHNVTPENLSKHANTHLQQVL